MAKSISRYLADATSTTGALDGLLSIAAQTNITSLGTLSSLTVSGSAAMTLTTAAQPNITSLGTLTNLVVDDITINGSTVSDAGDFTLDVGGDIILDTDGGDIYFHDGGTLFGAVTNSSGFYLISSISDADIFIRGNDGGNFINAVTFDMSEAGAATFNAGATFGGNVAVTGNVTATTTINIGSNNTTISENQLASRAGGGTGNHFYFDHIYASSDWIFRSSSSTERMRITSGGIVLIGGVTNTAGGYQFKVGGSDNQGELGLYSSSGASDLLSYDRTNSHYLTLNIHAGNTNFTQGEVGIKSTHPSDTSWGAAGTNAELAIGNTSSGSAYGVLHLLGHATQATRYSIGAGDGNLYLAYDDVAAAHRITVFSTGLTTFNGPASTVNLGGGSTGSAALYVNSTSGHAGEMLQILKNGATRMHMANDGKLGIGTASPGNFLHVKGTGETQVYIDAATNTNSGVRFLENGTNKWTIGNDNTNDGFFFYDFVDSVERMRISGTGVYCGEVGSNGDYTMYVGTVNAGGTGNRYVHVQIGPINGSMYWFEAMGHDYVAAILEGRCAGYQYNVAATYTPYANVTTGSIPVQYQTAAGIEIVIDTAAAGTSNRWGSVTIRGGTDTISGNTIMEIIQYSYTSTTARVY